MLKEIEEIRRALLALDALDDEAMEALSTLEAAAADIEGDPGSSRVRQVVSETAGALQGDSANADLGLSGKWDELKDHVAHWGEDHPSLVLAIGRLSNSLAAFGL